jgi:hypothetical protein
VSRGNVIWHRRVAPLVVVLLPLLAVTALYTTTVMLTTSEISTVFRPLIAFLDFAHVALLLLLFPLACSIEAATGF